MGEKKEFTLIDAYEQFWIALENGERRSLTTAYCTYGYLIHVWNGCGRPVSFRRQNTLICSELCLSKPTLDRHRNILKLAGLINFFSKGKGDANIFYEILVVKKLYYLPEKEKNVTTPVTTSVTTHGYTNQSKSIEGELFVKIEGEVKKLYYLQELFEQDVGLKMNWQQKGFPAEKFFAGLELWCMRHHGNVYASFKEARDHFFNWIPNYQHEIDKKIINGKTNGSAKPKSSKSSGAYELLDELREDIIFQQPGTTDG